MADWQRRLDISEIWKQGEDRTITHEDVAGEFEALSEDPDASVVDFDNVMERLYNWADTPMGGEFPHHKRACWVERWGCSKPRRSTG
jgi:hypothetical protein